jgi:hypothetical protein
MSRIRITKANEQNSLRVSNTVEHADIPIDGNFHEIHDDLLPVLDDSAVEYEIENAEAPSGSAAAEDAAGLGGSAASSPPKAPRKAKAKNPPKAKARQPKKAKAK